MSLVHNAVEALNRRSHRALGAAAALVCCVQLLGGCGGSSGSKDRAYHNPGVGGAAASVRSVDCGDWRRGSLDQRRRTVAQLRAFAGGPVGSSAGIQRGPVLDDGRAYDLFQSYCANGFARGFKLYKLYEHAAAFVGH